ncbi:hypothetical protein M1349_04495 [Patescibacteria group bacterium]|nr:hypothetical protein [Patescibacteria group bacterium]
MNKLYFFDLRPYPKYSTLTGKYIDIHSLMSSIQEPEIVNNSKLYLSSKEINNKVCTTKSNAWKKLIRTMLFLISGKTIEDKTLNIYAEAYRTLEKKFANKVIFDLQFVAFFSSMIFGFQISYYGWSEQNSNSMKDFLYFLDKIIERKDASIFVSSIFCAHRESDTTNKNTLVEKIKETSVNRYIYMLYSIFMNINAKKVNVKLYHPIGRKYALPVVFPNIANKYIYENRVIELLEKMNQHYQTIKNLIASLKLSSRIDMQLVALDDFINEVEQECEKICGANWRSINNFNNIKNEDLKVIARDMTLIDIKRYMPELIDSENLKIGNLSTINKSEKEAINWYTEKGQLKLHSKSLYETVFYYHWGQITKMNNGVAIGIDRDHDLFQVQAFSLGYANKVDILVNFPLLYARRTESELSSSNLNSVSIRQFWRLSENYKK